MFSSLHAVCKRQRERNNADLRTAGLCKLLCRLRNVLTENQLPLQSFVQPGFLQGRDRGSS